MSLVDDDRPARKPFPSDKNWAENYCFTGSDPKSGIGFWMHSGRWLQDLDIWREVVILRLPDGWAGRSALNSHCLKSRRRLANRREVVQGKPCWQRTGASNLLQPRSAPSCAS